VIPGGRVVRRSLAALVVGVACAALPAGAWAHAALLQTSPQASVTVDGSPPRVSLSYSEAVEPSFAVVSVTDAAAHPQTAGPPNRSAANPDTLLVPLKHLNKGWYLVFWRVISADGHPVRGAFTFAVGPNPGPAPQFQIPSLSETAATPRLLIARWFMFLSLMAAAGLLAFRLVIGRPLIRRVKDSSLRAVGIAVLVALGIGLVATPIYLDLATAEFTLRSAFDIGALIPLMHKSAFGRSLIDLEVVLALTFVAAAVALRVDRPDREHRSVAELLAGIGVILALGAALIVPGLAGHAAQYKPRGLSLTLDWLHLLSGGLWIGGLIALTLVGFTAHSSRRVASFVVLVPRFSRVAFTSVLVLITSGVVVSIIRLPTLASLWETGYGQALLVKIGFLLAALVLAALNMLRSKPRLEAAERRPGLGESTAKMLRRLVGGEVALVGSAIFVAGVLSSLPPPPKALGSLGKIAATVGPGSVNRAVAQAGYSVKVQIAPNKAAVPNAFAVKVTKNGKPVKGADVTAKFTMLDMDMAPQEYKLSPQGPATYGRNSVPSLVMVGRWGLTFSITPPGASPFEVLVVDHAEG
jgi:copper transport protein